jgi:hypothetical protein
VLLETLVQMEILALQELLVIQEIQAILVVQVDQVLLEHQTSQTSLRKKQDQLVHYHQLQLVLDQQQVRLSYRGQDSNIYN